MISRVAETCFWLLRQVERADATARLLRVHSGMLLDAALPPSRTWRPLLIVTGEEPAFMSGAGAGAPDDGDAVCEHLTWESSSPASILSCVREARNAARTIRETVSLEVWDTVNSTWLWLKEGQGRRLYGRDRSTFFEEVRRRCHAFHGACQNTMLHEEPFDFMRLGLNLERAGLTARALDLQYHALGPEGEGLETGVSAAEWIAILRACSAYEPFFKKRTAPLSGRAVTEFLLLEPAFPGSVHHALSRASNFLRRIRGRGDDGGGVESTRALDDLLGWLVSLDVEAVPRGGVHEVLTRIVDGAARVSEAVRQDYFSIPSPTDPVRPPPLPSVSDSTPPFVAATSTERSAGLVYSVRHATVYRYAEPVTESAHVFRLRPVDDHQQQVIEHHLDLSVPGVRREFEDVFGNRSVHFTVTEAYQELRIEARSIVRVCPGGGVLPGAKSQSRSLLPIAWMPWQHQMMLPYLLPPELLESELQDLGEFAKEFAERNGHDLADTLLDMTWTLNQELDYVPGVTSLETTPYEVFRTRRGVCQDFANLLICLARLERVPARYRVGYLSTAGEYQNLHQSEASHAWVEVYLPLHGWRGLDPTNGIATDMGHVRVAVGRNYRDASPTSGVIRSGGGGETLEVGVRTELLEGDGSLAPSPHP